MMKHKAKHKPKRGEVNIYRLPFWNRIIEFCIVVFNLLLVFPVFIFGVIDPSVLSLPEEYRGVFVIALFPMIYGFWLFSYRIFFQHLVVSEEGLDLFYPGWKAFAAWDDISHFGWSSPTAQASLGICLSQPVPRDMVWFYRLFLLRRREFIALDIWCRIPRRSFFSREVDIERFKQTPLGQDLLHYAPHLFEDEKTS